jgi:uncharacterized protein YbjT (DUF2867 family)
MARCLIVACGCRGRALAAGLQAAGHAVRGTTRRPSEAAALEAVGIEAHIGDPDRVATLGPALDHAVVVHLLLGSATGDEAALRALHGTRLDMLLSRMLDSTVRAIVYESAGTVSPEILAAGADRVEAVCEDSQIPYALLRSDPADHTAWLREALGATGSLLS